MDDRSRVLYVVVHRGGRRRRSTGILYLTESGRRFRLEIEPRLDNFVGEVQRCAERSEGRKATRFAVNEGRQSLYEITRERLTVDLDTTNMLLGIMAA